MFGDATNSTLPFKGRHFIQGVELDEGFVLEDDTDSSGEGFFTRVIAADSNGDGLNGNSVQINIIDPAPTDPAAPQVEDQVFRVAVRAATANSNPAPPETNGEITAFLKIYTGEGSTNGSTVSTSADVDNALADLEEERTYVGSIEVDIPVDELESHLPTYPLGELADLTVEGGVPLTSLGSSIAGSLKAGQGDSDGKQPFLVTSIRLKTEEDINQEADNNSSIWIHNGITNSYFSNGIEGDQQVDLKNLAYEITWEGITSTTTDAVQIDTGSNRGFGATGVSDEEGLSYAPFLQVPLTPATSIAQLSHAPINTSGLAPLTSQVIGNSFAPLSIPLESNCLLYTSPSPRD